MRVALVTLLLLVPTLLATPPTAASVPGYTVTIEATGLRDGVTYHPFVAERFDYSGLTPDDDPTDCRFFTFETPTCPETAPMPANQRYAWTVRVVDGAGEPVVGEWVSVDLDQGRNWGEDGSFGKTDQDGIFRFTEFGPVEGVARVVAEVEFFHPSEEPFWHFTFRAAGALPPEFPTVRILPEGEWVDLEIVPLAPAFLHVRFDVTTSDAPDGAVRAFFGEGHFAAGNRSWGISAVRLRLEDGDVHAEATTVAGTVGARHDLPEEVVQYSSGGGWAQWMGNTTPGNLSIRVTMGAFGMQDQPRLGLHVTGDPATYEIRELGRGAFRVAAGAPLPASATVNAVDFGGAHAGRWKAALTMPPEDSFLLTLAGVANVGTVQATVRHDQERATRTLTESWWWSFRQGLCGGDWDVTVRTTVSVTKPHALLVAGDGMPVSAWARDAWGMGTGCALPT